MARPYLYDALIGLRPGRKSKLVSAESQLVIEGFPRSANTFALVAFQMFNPGVPLGHHLHAPAHVHRATRLGKPIILLVREPTAAVLSYVIRNPTVDFIAAFEDYVKFYRAVWHLRDHFIVGLFDEVTTEFGAVVERLNRRFGTAFVPFDNTAENTSLALSIIEEKGRIEKAGQLLESAVARPSVMRTAQKDDLLAMLPAETSILRTTAQSWYERYVELQARQRMRFPSLDRGGATPGDQARAAQPER